MPNTYTKLNAGRSPQARLRCRASSASASAAAPRRAVVVLPGLGNNAADYGKLQIRLQEGYGLHVEVAPVARIDWCVFTFLPIPPPPRH